jgi:putative oxidoreductase
MSKQQNFWTDADIGILILRVTVGGLILFHGVHKVYAGIEEQMELLAASGIPTFLMYLVYITEIVAPILLILGIFTRLSAASIVATLLVILYVAPFPLTAIGAHGEWTIEVQLFYLLVPLALFFIGPGRFSVKPNASSNWLLD